MTSEEFLDRLRHLLRSLPPDDRQEALSYYEEYLADSPDPEAAMTELGSPAEVAAKILGEYVTDQTKSAKPKKGLPLLWAVVLAVFAVPVGVPVAAALGVVAIALVIVVVAVVVSLAATCVALVAGGIAGVGVGVAVIGQDLATAATLSGSGLVCAAIGLAGGLGVIVLSRWLVRSLTRGIGGFLVKRTAA